jgi:hypothetical protein
MCVDPPEEVAHGHGEEQIKEERVHGVSNSRWGESGLQGLVGLSNAKGRD